MTALQGSGCTLPSATGVTSGQSARGSGGDTIPVASAAGNAPGSAADVAADTLLALLRERNTPLPPLLLPWPCRLDGLMLRPRRLLGRGSPGRSRSGELLREGGGRVRGGGLAGV